VRPPLAASARASDEAAAPRDAVGAAARTPAAADAFLALAADFLLAADAEAAQRVPEKCA